MFVKNNYNHVESRQNFIRNLNLPIGVNKQIVEKEENEKK